MASVEEKAQKDLADKQAAGASQADIDAAKKAVEDAQKEIGKATDCYSFVNAIAGNEAKIKANEKEIEENAKNFTVDPSDATKVTGTGKLITDVTAEVDTKIAADRKSVV